MGIGGGWGEVGMLSRNWRRLGEVGMLSGNWRRLGEGGMLSGIWRGWREVGVLRVGAWYYGSIVVRWVRGCDGVGDVTRGL